MWQKIDLNKCVKILWVVSPGGDTMDTYRNNMDRKYIYSDEFLKSKSIFPLLIFDGGAYFLIKEIMGSRNPYSRDLFEFITSGELFDNWKSEGAFDWDVSYKRSLSSKLPINAEHHVWINRLYFLLPLAQEFLITKDEKWSSQWLSWLKDWMDKHPYQQLDWRPHNMTDYVWRDMQVAWRLLVLLHSIKMLRDAKSFTEEDLKVIYDCVHMHAEHLYKEGSSHINAQKAHNHILQIGLVLLMTGVLFPEFSESEKYRTAGREIIKINIKKALYDDGGSVEGCPSYSHFIARMYLEAYLLLDKNKLEPICGLKECIVKQYNWLYQMMPPTGRTLQIGDSYALDAKEDLELVKTFIDLDLPKSRGSVLLKESRFAALRNDHFEVFVDAMDRTQGHQHFGRPHFVVFKDDRPLIIDTGCCVYDRKDFRDFLMGSGAHNTVEITLFDTNEVLTDSEVQINLEKFYNDSISFKTKGRAFSWIRDISLEGSSIRIRDRIKTDSKVSCKLLFHFAPSGTAVLSDNTAVVDFNGKDIFLTLEKSNSKLKKEVRPAMNDKNEFFYSSVIFVREEGNDFEFNTVIH